MECIFAQIRIEFHQLKSIRGVALILTGRVIAFPILGTHDSDNFSNFAFFLRHGTNLSTLLRTRQNIYYGQKTNRFAMGVRLLCLQSSQMRAIMRSIDPVWAPEVDDYCENWILL